MTALGLAGCGGVLDPKGPIGSADKTILLNSLAIMMAIVVPTIVATLLFGWWFRSRNRRAVYRPDWAYSGQIELVTWTIPAMVVILLGTIAWVGSHDLDPSKPLASATPPIEVQVVSLDWKWLFIYPTFGVASINRLTIPVNAPLHLRLTSSSVMNSLFIPQLGSQIYTMSGMATQLNLQASETGSYVGFSAQFSGDGFADMRFAVDVVPPSQFAAWVASQRDAGKVLDEPTYAELTRPTSNVAPRSFGKVSAGLFEAILNSKTAPLVRAREADGATEGMR